MKYLWGGLIAGILGLGFINAFIIRFGRAADIFTLLHIVLSIWVLLRYKQGLREILIFAFLIRVVLMLWDIRFDHIFSLPNSGADSGMYYNEAQRVSQDLSLLTQDIRGGPFAKIIGTIFHLTGFSRLLGQYINVLLGMSVVMIVNRITALFKLSVRARRNTLLLAAFFPNSMVMSAIFLREIFPTFLVAASLYFFVRWYLKPALRDMVLSLLMLAFSSMFHSGVAGIFLGYAFAFLFYKHRTKRFSFTTNTILSFVVVAAAVYLATNVFQEQLFGKFSNIEEMEDIYQTANNRYGGSAYLTNLKINNLWQFFVFGPIKMVYFLSVPLPWNWRGGMDIFSFVADSMLYLYVVVTLYRNRRLFGEHKPLMTALALMLLGAVIIFGIGVSNAGTAIRHRQKLVPIFLISLGVLMDIRVKIRSRAWTALQSGRRTLPGLRTREGYDLERSIDG